MKPDWKDAPEWANFLAMDPDASWWWFEVKPSWDGEEWVSYGVGQFALALEAGRGDTLEARPEGA